jgi:hypothetical protein
MIEEQLQLNVLHYEQIQLIVLDIKDWRLLQQQPEIFNPCFYINEKDKDFLL